ncbi:MAG TPA: MBL fold metallo-hydrolase [Methylomirabilota bacterium]|nr:MBL fold metallo-hydrolase [Methylomirabilota bacterium]
MDRRGFLRLTTAATVVLAAPAAWAQTAKVEVHWLGQASTKITTPTGKVIVIDPFLTNNPKTPAAFKNLDSLGKVDAILVTHGHGDHVGDVAELAKRTGATVLGPGGSSRPSWSWAGSLPTRPCASARAARLSRSGRVSSSRRRAPSTPPT